VKIKILITTEFIGFSVLDKIHNGLVIVLGYFNLIFKFSILGYSLNITKISL